MDTPSESMPCRLDLIRRAQAGEHEALELVFARYYAPVRAYVSRRLGPILRLEVESLDIMQETFLIAVEQFDRFLKAWIAARVNAVSA